MTMQEQIQNKLNENLEPSFLEVINESHGHAVAPGSETHFKVIAVSKTFEGKRSVQRHQLVYKLLADELASGVHALALHTYTSEEWQQQNQAAPESPNCMGANKS